MTNIFGNTFKNLRKPKNLTQDQISEALGISCQAISKWETNTSYPDISLLPIIADYFSVSIDHLLGHDTSKQKDEIEAMCTQSETMFTNREYLKSIPSLREMLVKHPGNEKLMYTLAWALSGTLTEVPENYEEASYYANQLPTFELCHEYNLGRANLLDGLELSHYLQSNIQLFGNAMLECFEYFTCENILSHEEKKPYTTESAKLKIKMLKKILSK